MYKNIYQYLLLGCESSARPFSWAAEHGREQGNDTADGITELLPSTLGADIQEVAKYPWAAYCSIVFVIGFVIAFATGPDNIQAGFPSNLTSI